MKKTLSNQRLCVATKKKYSKDRLIKITRVNGTWKRTDESYLGRSIYILSDQDIINSFLKLKKHRIRHFQMNEELKEDLREYAQNL